MSATRVAWVPAGALAALVAISLTGCSSGNAINTGPLGNGSSPGSACIPASSGGLISDGLQALRNSGSGTAVVQKVHLTNPHHLIIKVAWIVPIHGTNFYGFLSGTPGGKGALPGVEWSQRVRAPGARIPPAHDHHAANLVLVLKMTGRKGTAKAVDVFYRESGQQYHLRYNTSVEVVQAKAAC
jgi:hypothetical protein